MEGKKEESKAQSGRTNKGKPTGDKTSKETISKAYKRRSTLCFMNINALLMYFQLCTYLCCTWFLYASLSKFCCTLLVKVIPADIS